jgi:hypothetical protein
LLTGQRDQVSPSDDSSLEDTTVDHPANKHGLDVELTVGLTFPTTKEVAIAFGQSYLASSTARRTGPDHGPGTHPRPRRPLAAGVAPAGETISVVDHPNDSPR